MASSDINSQQSVRHSEGVNEILTVTPPFLLRWGILIFFILLIMIAILSSVISYPDIITSQLKIISNNYLKTPHSPFLGQYNRKEFLGEMHVFQKDIGKLKKGQIVKMKLLIYPFEEYGILKGQITKITDSVNSDGKLLVLVNINTKKSTDLKKPIRIKEGLLANADIITEESTIFQRLFRRVMPIFGRTNKKFR